MNLPPLPVLPVLPPLPPLAPLTIGDAQQAVMHANIAAPVTLPLPFELPPVVEEYKRTAWYPLKITPFHAGNYELGFETDAGTAAAHPGRHLWDGREWADKLPAHCNVWRGWDRSRWVNIRAENPPLPGWYSMRYPRADKKAPSYWDGVQWMYAHPTTGEMLAYKMHPKWDAEWFHDGAP